MEILAGFPVSDRPQGVQTFTYYVIVSIYGKAFFRRVYPTVVSVFHIYRRKLPHRCTLATSSISEISVLLISMQTHLPRCCTSARSCSILENLLNNTLRSWRILSRQQSHIICVCLITASIWIVSLQYFLRVSS